MKKSIFRIIAIVLVLCMALSGMVFAKNGNKQDDEPYVIDGEGIYTPCNKMKLSTGVDLIIINKGNADYVLSESKITEGSAEKAYVESLLASKDMARFSVGKNGTVDYYAFNAIPEDLGFSYENGVLTFKKASSWSLLYAGPLSTGEVATDTDIPIVIIVVPDPEEYAVYHNFSYFYANGDVYDKTVPAVIEDALPAKYSVEDGETVRPAVLSFTEYNDEVANGKWEFKGFTPDSAVIDGEDFTFQGKWVFTPNEAPVTPPERPETPPEVTKYTAAYEYKYFNADDTEYTGAVPAAISRTIPVDGEEYDDKATVDAKQPGIKSYADTAADGTWAFKGYDADSKTIDGANITFTGKWVFTPNPADEGGEEGGSAILSGSNTYDDDDDDDTTTTIGDGDTPLAALPDGEVPLADGDDLEEVLDEELPLADAPATGDNAIFYIAAMTAALGAIVIGLKKKENN